MVELGTRCTTERVQSGNSPPTVARAAFLSRQLARAVLRVVYLSAADNCLAPKTE